MEIPGVSVLNLGSCGRAGIGEQGLSQGNRDPARGTGLSAGNRDLGRDQGCALGPQRAQQVVTLLDHDPSQCGRCLRGGGQPLVRAEHHRMILGLLPGRKVLLNREQPADYAAGDLMLRRPQTSSMAPK